MGMGKGKGKGTVGNCVGRARTVAGLRQRDLASRVGVSRQSLSMLEAGRSTPSAALALRLSRELGCRVEELFWMNDQRAPLSVELAAGDPPFEEVPRPRAAGRTGVGKNRRPTAERSTTDARVVLASINGRWVAHRLAAGDSGSFQTTADGLISGRQRGDKRTVKVRPLDDSAPARDTLLCAGCAPAFGILASRATDGGRGGRVVWLEQSSGAALDLLANGHVHVAGAHLYDEEAHEFNVPFVRRRLPGRSMLIFNLARWEVGLVVAPGNPRQIRGARDLARRDVSFIRRQPGAAAQDLVDRLLRREGLQAPSSSAHITARGHMEVARLVALGVADTGVALPSVARAHGLDFIPLGEERFDLVLSKELAGDARVVRLLETISGRGFLRELDSLGGHVTRDAGRLIADTSDR
jgi:putative molybdopterin biosynthesis protein